MPKGVTIRLFRAEQAGNVPSALEQGELAVDALSNPPRLWTGVPVSRDPSGLINLLDTGAGGVVGDWWSPITPTSPGIMAGWATGSNFRIGTTALPNHLLVNTSTQTVSMGSLISFTLPSGNAQVGNSFRVTGSATAPTGMAVGTGGTLWYDQGSSPGTLRYWNGQSWVSLGSPFAAPAASDQTLQSSGTSAVWRTNLGIGIAPLPNVGLRVYSGLGGELIRLTRYGLNIGWHKLWGLTAGAWGEEGMALSIFGDDPHPAAPQYHVEAKHFPNAYSLIYNDNPGGMGQLNIAVTHNPAYAAWLRTSCIGPTARQFIPWYGTPTITYNSGTNRWQPVTTGPGGATVPHMARATANWHCDMPMSWSFGLTWPYPNGVDWYYWEQDPIMRLDSFGLWLPSSTTRSVRQGNLAIGTEPPIGGDGGDLIQLASNVNGPVHIDIDNQSVGAGASSGICFMNDQYEHSWINLHSTGVPNNSAGHGVWMAFQGPSSFNLQTAAPGGIRFLSSNLNKDTAGISFWAGPPHGTPVFRLTPWHLYDCSVYVPDTANLWVDDWLGGMECWIGQCYVDELKTQIWRFNDGWPQYYWHWPGPVNAGTLIYHTDGGMFLEIRRVDHCLISHGGMASFWWADLSDVRTKIHIEPEHHGLDTIRALNPIDFDHIGEGDHLLPPPPPRRRLTRPLVGNQSGLPFDMEMELPELAQMPHGRPRMPHHQVGFSAQEVQAVLPDAVVPIGVELPDGSGTLDSGEPTLAIMPMALIAVAVNAIKELEQRIIALEQNGNGNSRTRTRRK